MEKYYDYIYIGTVLLAFVAFMFFNHKRNKSPRKNRKGELRSKLREHRKDQEEN